MLLQSKVSPIEMFKKNCSLLNPTFNASWYFCIFYQYIQAMQETSDFSILLKDMDGTNGELKQFARMVSNCPIMVEP